MSDWMNCPLSRIVVSFAGGDILTGLELFGPDINLKIEQEQKIEEIRRTYRKNHHELSINLQKRVDDIHSILRNHELNESDKQYLFSKIDDHTKIINDMEKLWISSVYDCFQILDSSTIKQLQEKVDNYIEPFNNKASLIGSI